MKKTSLMIARSAGGYSLYAHDYHHVLLVYGDFNIKFNIEDFVCFRRYLKSLMTQQDQFYVPLDGLELRFSETDPSLHLNLSYLETLDFLSLVDLSVEISQCELRVRRFLQGQSD